MNDRPGCLWWLVTMTVMAVGCVGGAAVVEATSARCWEGNLSTTCAAQVIDYWTTDSPPR